MPLYNADSDNAPQGIANTFKITEGRYSRDNHRFSLCLGQRESACWMAWTAYGPRGSRGFARFFDGERMHGIQALPGDDQAAQMNPLCVSGPQGPSLVWFDKRDNTYRLCRCATEAECPGRLGNAEVLHTFPARAKPNGLQAAVTGDGAWWFAWAQPAAGKSSIEVLRMAGGEDSRQWSVGAATACNYRPRLIAFAGQGAYLAWDAYSNGCYSVHGCALAPGDGPAPVQTIGAGNEWETRPALCRAPGDNGLWCCWVRCEDIIWKQSVIHQKYAVRAARLRGNAWEALTTNEGDADIAPLHYGLLTDFDRAPPALGHQGRRLHPMLRSAADGSVWLLYETKADDAVQTLESKGRLVGLRWHNGAWSEPLIVAEGLVYYRLPEAERLPLECPCVARDIDKDRPDHDVDELHLRRLRLEPDLPELPGERRTIDLTHWQRIQLPMPELPDPAGQQTELPGKTQGRYQLIWGDFHVHSVGSVECEGELDELAHYARDKARIHALTISDNDHFWSCEIRKNQRWLSDEEWDANVANAGVLDEPGRFALFPGYEQTIGGARKGVAVRLLRNHSSVMADDEDMERDLLHFREEVVEARREGRRLSSKDILECVQWAAEKGYYPLPHAHVNWWRLVAPAIQTACDVTSAWMRNIEEYDIYHRYLNQGLRFGFTGSSDSHYRNPGFGGALTGLWVKDVTRAGVLEALRSRRTYATAGERILVEFAVDDTFMGGACVANDDPILRWRVVGDERRHYELRVLRDGRPMHTERFRGHCAGQVRDERLSIHRGGQHYYYLEIVADEPIPTYRSNAAHALGGRAWSTPVWVETADWIAG